METLWVVINIIVFLLFIGLLGYLNKKHVKFSKRVLIGLGIGIVFGLALHLIYGVDSKVTESTASWFDIVGTGYVKLLQMIVMPLIFISIVSAFTKITIGQNFAKAGAWIFTFLLGTVAVAALVGIIYAMLFNLDASQLDLGSVENSRGQEIEQTSKDMAANNLPSQILELLPANPFLDFTGARGTSTIAIVIFAGFVGFSFLRVMRKEPEKGNLIKRGIDAIYALVMGIVTFVLRLTPYGILAIMTKTVMTSNFEAVWTLGKFVVASYAALITMFIIHLILVSVVGLNPATYVKKASETLLFAFTSRSSAGTLPLNVQTQTTRLGVPEGIANFAGSFGLSIGQNGCAGIYPAMLAMMIAPSAGIDIDLPFILSVIGVVVISSFGVAGVGGGATFAAILVLSTLNLPIALAGVLISVEPLIDMGRTALNVNDSMLAGTATAKITGQLDEEKYNDQDFNELGESY
ncbi:L-cystine transporter [Mammaliicoccus sciuri]|uniref:L-cystine transporter n=1 Tax=Mammaliicoccus sciuri TaxID=1296 RepID=UPI000E68A565|nr:L-cystine transporter [Mammaliicoccus sciuri]RIN87094.1 L-cystine transporter [Mammaliicoccus sciuri]